MAETARFLPDKALELEQILQEASHRWFRPPEICEILSNHSKYYVNPEPPVRPPAGSLFLFDRKVLRYFRKDGHNWRKKKDGKTIKEAHEKLKVDGVDALHCYYARGEDNENFQRRIYWLLDMQFEHIVLVHYREVDEGHKIGLSHLLTPVDPGSQHGSSKTSSASWSEHLISPVQASFTSNSNKVDWIEHGSPPEFGDKGSRYPGDASNVHPVQGATDDTLLAVDKGTEFSELPKHNLVLGLNDESYIPPTSSSWTDAEGSSKTLGVIQSQKLHFDQPNTADLLSQKLIDARLDGDKALQNVSSDVDGWFPNTEGVVQVVGASDVAPESSGLLAGIAVDEAAELKKSDSFGRWMDREIGKDCDDPLTASDSANYWSAVDAATDYKEALSLAPHMQLDADSLGPSLAQEQLFSISDIAPAWAYSGVAEKVLIVGSFLGDKKLSDGHKWCCMFGETEVPCDILSDNIIRCHVPHHLSGRVPFYVSCGNRLACSEVLEFEFLKKPLRFASFAIERAAEEVSMQMQLAKLLCLGLEREWLDCSSMKCEKCKVKTKICTLQGFIEMARAKSEEVIAEATCRNFKDIVIQELLKNKLFEWLVCKAHEGDKGPNVLNHEGQGVIHLTASLGYVWALGPIIAAGGNPNFRDKQGRTPLHWASYFGREEAVVELIKLGTASGAVDDPTSEFPGGRTAADLASDRGHKGIAGYLAEADLTSQLVSLSITEDFMGTTVAPQTATEKVVPINAPTKPDLSLKGSLAAVTKSAHAAAMIQAAFRAHSFRLRQLTQRSNDVSTDLVALGSLNRVQKVGHFDDYLHSAAIKIQQKYRGWKGRKDFLRIRSRIVKLQAHVRGHQVRRQYKKVLWSVSVVEKVILRWRRKKPGLRGFRTATASEGTPSHIDNNDEYEYLRISRRLKLDGIEKALARVQSMVRHPEARDQYMRLVKLGNFKLNNDESN